MGRERHCGVSSPGRESTGTARGRFGALRIHANPVLLADLTDGRQIRGQDAVRVIP